MAASPGAWFVELAEEQREAEFNGGEIELLVRRIDADDRLSERC